MFIYLFTVHLPIALYSYTKTFWKTNEQRNKINLYPAKVEYMVT